MASYVTDVCPDCGNLRSVCSDPDIAWYPQRSYCYAKAARDQIWRRTWAQFDHPDQKTGAPHVTDGLVWGMARSDLTPEDDFFGEGPLVGRPGDESLPDDA